MSNTTKSIRELAKQITDEGSYVYTNDAGQGTGGPSIVDPSTLSELVTSGEIDDYTPMTGSEADEIIAATLDAHRHDKTDGTRWILAERIADDGQSNPYRHYLLLWDAES